MKKRWICLLAALVLVAGTCTHTPMTGTAAKLEADDGGYVTGSCSLTVHPENPNKGDGEGFGEDLTGAGVVVDLYRIAKAVKTPGYDTYHYEWLIELSGNTGDGDSDQMTGEWDELAKQAAEIVLNETAPVTPAVQGAPVGREISGLEPGLYLMVARGSKLTQMSDYKIKITQKDSATQEKTDRIATIANSELHSYAFLPQLVSLPTKEADANGVIHTGNPGDWEFSMEVNLKPEQLPRYGSLRIVKTLSEYETMGGVQESATFVFDITGTLDGEVVYTNVEAITFTAAGQESVVLNRIPAGTEVTVKEVYSGSSYQLTVPGDRRAAIAADTVVSVEFENEYDGRRTNGHGIKNQFVYDEETGRWNWYSSPVQDAAGNMGEAGSQNTSGQGNTGSQNGTEAEGIPGSQESNTDQNTPGSQDGNVDQNPPESQEEPPADGNE